MVWYNGDNYEYYYAYRKKYLVISNEIVRTQCVRNTLFCLYAEVTVIFFMDLWRMQDISKRLEGWKNRGWDMSISTSYLRNLWLIWKTYQICSFTLTACSNAVHVDECGSCVNNLEGWTKTELDGSQMVNKFSISGDARSNKIRP